ncbi:MAG: hypothetical protein ACI9BK_002407, partial [Acidimicrobiales bacterium]
MLQAPNLRGSNRHTVDSPSQSSTQRDRWPRAFGQAVDEERSIDVETGAVARRLLSNTC